MADTPYPPGMEQHVLDAVRRGIRERRLVEFRYRGRRRVVLPLRLGRTRRGIWMVRALQVDGSTSSGLLAPDVPKLFRAAQMTGARLRATTFAVPRAYGRGDDVLVEIDAEL